MCTTLGQTVVRARSGALSLFFVAIVLALTVLMIRRSLAAVPDLDDVLPPWAPLLFAAPSIERHKETLVVYSGPTSNERNSGTTADKQELYHRNFHFFLRKGGVRCDSQDTIFVLTNETARVYSSEIHSTNKRCLTEYNHTVTLLIRDPLCYDQESVRLVLTEDRVDLQKYDYIVYINCGMSGPFVPTPEIAWTHYFTSRLNKHIKMTGLSLNCMKGTRPHVQSFAFALDRIGLQIVRKSAAIFDCRSMDSFSLTELVERYEIGMSEEILEHGYGIQSLLPPPGGTTLFSYNKTLCMARDYWYPSKIRGMFHGRMPNPQETLFFKASRFLPSAHAELIKYPGGAFKWTKGN